MGNFSPHRKQEGSMPDGQNGSFIARLIADSMGFIWLVLLALWGGTASYVTRIRKAGAPFRLIELIGEWSISGFAGVITMMICNGFGYSFYMTAALTGIAGHLGGRAVYIFEQFFANKLGVNSNHQDTRGDRE